MNRWLLVAASLAFLPAAAHGGVISRDWKTPGDGLLTYDDVNKREWLDLSESRLSTFPGDTAVERYQSVLYALAAGGGLEGFIAASSNDLRELASSAGISTGSLDSINDQPTRRLISLVGATAAFPVSGSEFATSLLHDLNTNPTESGMNFFGDVFVVRIGEMRGSAGILIRTGIEPFQIAGLGVWLYRNEIPEPGSLVIALWCVCLMHQIASFRTT